MTREVLLDVEAMLQEMLGSELLDSTYAGMIEHLAKKAGFHALMKSATASWARLHPGHNRLLGPNQKRVTSLLSRVRAALKSSSP